jgi:uncharacterized protein (DUF427 family)
MAVPMGEVVLRALPQLRTHPVHKRVRAAVGDVVVVDSAAPVLVWEPRRVVPSYAVPRGDVLGGLVPDRDPVTAEEQPVPLGSDERRVLDPRTPFTAHSTPGTSLSVQTPSGDLPGAAFAPDDADLAGHVVLDWDAFTQWWEEEEPVMGHPHDPFGRIDCLRSSRRVVLAADGQVLADSDRTVLLLETQLPVRYYFPREDVATELLEPSDTRTVCAYKGWARYWSAMAGDRVLRDIAWSYEEPLHDAVPVGDRIAFFTERLDLVVDGVAQPRPVSPWSEPRPG